MSPSIRIYMKPYLVDFARCMISNNEFANQDLIIKIIKPFLRRGSLPGKPPKPPSHLHCLELSLPLLSDLYIGDNKVYIHPRDMKSIAGIFQSHFDAMLFFYISDKFRYYGEFKKCIYQFAADLDISFENINYDMMWKKYQRFRQKNEQKKTFISSFSVQKLSNVIPFLI